MNNNDSIAIVIQKDSEKLFGWNSTVGTTCGRSEQSRAMQVGYDISFTENYQQLIELGDE